MNVLTKRIQTLEEKMFTFSTRLAADRILSAVFDVINDVALFLLALWCCQGLTP